MGNTKAFEQPEYEKELLSFLDRGEEEMTAGVGHDLDSVFTEADDLLAENPS